MELNKRIEDLERRVSEKNDALMSRVEECEQLRKDRDFYVKDNTRLHTELNEVKTRAEAAESKLKDSAVVREAAILNFMLDDDVSDEMLLKVLNKENMTLRRHSENLEKELSGRVPVAVSVLESAVKCLRHRLSECGCDYGKEFYCGEKYQCTCVDMTTIKQLEGRLKAISIESERGIL